MIAERLAELGLRLPRPLEAPPGGRFAFDLVRVDRAGLVHLAGHAPMDGPEVLFRGRLGDDLDVEQGYRAARQVALAMLASLAEALGDLDRVGRWLRATGWVCCTPAFTQQAAVLNGFSDLIVELWGEAGRHVRAAPGAHALGYGVPVIVEATAELA